MISGVHWVTRRQAGHGSPSRRSRRLGEWQRRQFGRGWSCRCMGACALRGNFFLAARQGRRVDARGRRRGRRGGRSAFEVSRCRARKSVHVIVGNGQADAASVAGTMLMVRARRIVSNALATEEHWSVIGGPSHAPATSSHTRESRLMPVRARANTRRVAPGRRSRGACEFIVQ